MKIINTFSLISLLWGFSFAITGRELTVRLPTGRYLISAVYDGMDSIYLLGGATEDIDGVEFFDEILKFDINSETIETIGLKMPQNISSGSSLMIGTDIFYFGGYNSSRNYVDEIVKINPSTSEASVVAHLPKPNDGKAVWDNGDKIYLFGGGGTGAQKSIIRYNISTNEAEEIGSLFYGKEGPAAIWDDVASNAFIFGGQDRIWNTNEIVKFTPANLNDGTNHTEEMLEDGLPSIVVDAMAAWDGTYAYIIGGAYNTAYQGLFIFNPVTYEMQTIYLNALPNSYFYHAGVAYAQRLNTIYLFGGWSGYSRSQIIAIELDS